MALIALGYGESQGISHKIKTMKQVSNATSNSPILALCSQFLLEARHILVTVNKRIFGSNLLKLVALRIEFLPHPPESA